MVDKGFELGDPVWAKMKGYPPWPGEIIEPPEPHLKKKNHHYVNFFGSDNHAWISDANIFPHSQSLIEKYSTKKMKALRSAIDQIIDYCNSLPSTSTSGEGPTTFADEKSSSSDGAKADNEISKPGPGKSTAKYPPKKSKSGKVSEKRLESCLKKGICGTKTVRFRTNFEPSSSSDGAKADNEISKPGPSKSTAKDLPKKCRSGKVSEKRQESRFKKGIFGTKTVRFRTNFDSRKSKAETIARSEIILITPQGEADVLSDTEIDSDSETSTDSDSERPTYLPPTRKKIGLMGLTDLGLIILGNLLKSGHSVIAYDRFIDVDILRDLNFTVEVATSPREVGRNCDIIFSCGDIYALNKYVYHPHYGVAAGLRGCNGKKGYVELLSVGEQKAVEIGALIRQAGAMFMDAPVTTTQDLAENGELNIFASGSIELFKSCATIFHAISTTCMYVGEEDGKANACSAIFNSFAGAQSVALAEGMAIANEAGVSKLDMMMCLELLGYGSRMIKHQGLKIMNNDFINTSYSLDKQQKDMQTALQMAEKVNQPMMITSAASQAFVHARRLRFRTDDSSVVYMALKK